MFPSSLPARLALFLLCLLPPAVNASDIPFYYMNVTPTVEGNKIRVDFTPQPLFSHSVLDGSLLDRVVRDSIESIADINRNYDLGNKRKLLITLKVMFAVNLPNGDLISRKQSLINLSLDQKENLIRYHSPSRGKGAMDMDEAVTEAGYQELLKEMFGSYTISERTLRKEDHYLASFKCKAPNVHGDYPEFSRLWRRGILRAPGDGFVFQLGSAYWFRSGATWQSRQSVHMEKLRQVVDELDQAFVLFNEGSLDESLAIMEPAFEELPSSIENARTLLFMYQSTGQTEKLLNLNACFQPFFLDFVGKKDPAWNRKMSGEYQLDPNAWVLITSPKPADLIAGKTEVAFVVKDNRAQTLRVDCLLDGRVVDSINRFPTQFTINPTTSGNHRLSVVAYFANDTMARHEIELSSLKVDASEEVNLVRLQVVVSSMGKPVSGLSLDDFQLIENGRALPVASLEPLDSPLNLGLLMDTSGSMQGDNIKQAIYATDVLVDQLRDGERFAAYSFDDKVLRLKNYDEPIERFKPLLYTLHPQLGTSLRDALLVARADLTHRKKDINALIVLSDGRDTNSSTTSEELLGMMEADPIRLYSINMDGESKSFLKRATKRSGGFLKVARSRDDLKGLFQEVLDETRNVYELTYYSAIPEDRQRKLKIKTSKGAARWLQVSNSR